MTKQSKASNQINTATFYKATTPHPAEYHLIKAQFHEDQDFPIYLLKANINPNRTQVRQETGFPLHLLSNHNPKLFHNNYPTPMTYINNYHSFTINNNSYPLQYQTNAAAQTATPPISRILTLSYQKFSNSPIIMIVLKAQHHLNPK